MRSRVKFLALAFVLGCLVASTTGLLAAAPARAEGAPQKWEQKCVGFRHHKVRSRNVNDADDSDGWNRALMQYGAEGWELVSVLYHHDGKAIIGVCFKRPC